MRIDTGADRPDIMVVSGAVEDGQRIVIRDHKRAQNLFNRIRENIEAHELPDDLDEYMSREDLVLDALHLFDDALALSLREIYEDHRIFISAGGSGAPVTAQSQQPEKAKKMFAIDTGSTGSQGPWVSWTSNGSAMKGFKPSTWVLRDKDADGHKIEEMVPAFENGCVMDIDSLKLGWEKDGAQGTAPERRWNPSISQATPRPDESKKPSGAYAWSRALSVRLAIGGGKAATWEQGSFGAYRAFENLATQIQAQYPGDGTLPLVKQTGVQSTRLPSGNANIPMLEIVKWVPRPDCLKADAPQIDTGPSSIYQQPPAPAPQPVQQVAAPADAEF